MNLQLQIGLPEDQRAAAAALYWQAFGGKLGAVMGPDARALRFLTRVLRADHAVVALDGAGQLVGLAGFKTTLGSFAGGDLADMRAEYGLFGILWRAPLLQLLSREIDNDRFLLDGICVASGARGQGVGTALLAAICDTAQARGYSYVRLDVIDSNWRAKALYVRLGFVAIKTEDIGLLRYVFGFRRAVTMVKPI